MNTPLPIGNIPLRQIDPEDDRYRLLPSTFTEKDDPALRDSIKRCGILHPPILQEKAAGLYGIVSGRRRLGILEQLPAGDRSCHCLLLSRDCDPETSFTVLLEEALATRPPSPVETAVFFRKVLEAMPAGRAAGIYLPLLGLSPAPFLIERMLTLLDLEDPLLQALHSGRLAESAARELTGLAFRDRLALFELIEELQLSAGKQKKLVRGCRTLAKRENKSIADLLSTEEVRAIFRSPANRPQQAGRLMQWLDGRYAPGLTAAVTEFRKFTGSLRLPGNASLSHSPAFERDTLTLTLTFSDRRDFLEHWPGIRRSLTDRFLSADVGQ